MDKILNKVNNCKIGSSIERSEDDAFIIGKGIFPAAYWDLNTATCKVPGGFPLSSP